MDRRGCKADGKGPRVADDMGLRPCGLVLTGQARAGVFLEG